MTAAQRAATRLQRCLAGRHDWLAEPQRLSALIKDVFRGEDTRERNLLLLALQQRLPQALLARLEPLDAAISRAGQNLHRAFGVEAGLAHWAAQSWAQALELKPPARDPAADTLTVSAPFARPLPLSITRRKRPAAPAQSSPRRQLRKRPPGSG